MAAFAGLPSNPAIDALKARAQWVGWRYEFRNGPDKKPTKPPVSPKSGFAASHSNPATWGTYDQALDLALRRKLPGVGYVLTGDDGLCGIDLDGCRNVETGELQAWADEIVDLAETYAEISPSGEGIRLFAEGKPTCAIKSDAAHIEIYGANRYLTVTGQHLPGTPLAICPAPRTIALLQERIDELKAEAGISTAKRGDVQTGESRAETSTAYSLGGDVQIASETGLDEVAVLLGHVPADVGYDEWLQALMAVHAATGGSSSGLSIADQWSSHGSKYKAGEVDRKWQSFKSGGVNGASLAALARQYGADLSAVRIAHMPQDTTSIDIGAAFAERISSKGRLIEHPDGTITDQDGEIVEPEVGAGISPVAVDPGFPPGLVGDIAQWICDTALQPQPGLALGAALAIVGTAAGRQFSGPTQSATHLYVLGLAGTGQGKDHALQQISRIMTAAQLGQHIGPSEFISMPAVVNFVTRSPLSLCAMDEFGDFVARIMSKKASSFERSVAKLLRSFWGVSFGVYHAPEWAGRTSDPIYAPAMSIYGASTPEQFWRAIEGGAVEDGTLNRFLVMGGGADVDEREPAYAAHIVPQYIIDGLRSIFERSGPMAMSTRNAADQDPAGKRRLVGWDGAEAEQVYLDLKERTKARMKDVDAAPFYARTKEMAVRIATIVSLGRLDDREAVTVDDMRFGTALAEASSARMVAGAADYLSDSENQANAQKIRRIIKARGGRVQRKALLRAMQHSVRARELNDLLMAMEEAEDIVIDLTTPPGGGTETKWYRLLR